MTSDAPDPLAPSALAAVISAAETAERATPRTLPPVHLWDPPNCGDIDILIRRDGAWLHEGSPIGRPALVRLFSTVLRKDEDGVYLVTPVEKLRITVEDAPFLAVRVDRVGEGFVFTTNVGDQVAADAEHPLRVATGAQGEPAPYVLVRGALEARLTRPVFYELVAMAEARDGPGGSELGVVSNGVWFALGPAGEADV